MDDRMKVAVMAVMFAQADKHPGKEESIGVSICNFLEKERDDEALRARVQGLLEEGKDSV
jgi:hypothetical protein